MALAMPPPVSPTGLGNCVKKAKSSELAPFWSRLKSTKASGAITNAGAHQAQARTRMELLIFLH